MFVRTRAAVQHGSQSQQYLAVWWLCPVLAQCFWPRLGVKVACVSGLVLACVWSGVCVAVWSVASWFTCFGRVLSCWTAVALRAGSAVSWFGDLV